MGGGAVGGAWRHTPRPPPSPRPTSFKRGGGGRRGAAARYRSRFNPGASIRTRSSRYLGRTTRPAGSTFKTQTRRKRGEALGEAGRPGPARRDRLRGAEGRSARACPPPGATIKIC